MNIKMNKLEWVFISKLYKKLHRTKRFNEISKEYITKMYELSALGLLVHIIVMIHFYLNL